MNRPLRVLIGADTYPPDFNGAARFTARLAAGLARRGHEVHVVAPSDTGAASSPVRGAARFRACTPSAAWGSGATRPSAPRTNEKIPLRRSGVPGVPARHHLEKSW